MEDLLSQLEDLDFHIENLEKMYQYALELEAMNEEEYKLDTNFTEVRDEIDIRLTDYKEERENVMQDIEDYKDNEMENAEKRYYRNNEL